MTLKKHPLSEALQVRHRRAPFSCFPPCHIKWPHNLTSDVPGMCRTRQNCSGVCRKESVSASSEACTFQRDVPDFRTCTQSRQIHCVALTDYRVLANGRVFIGIQCHIAILHLKRQCDAHASLTCWKDIMRGAGARLPCTLARSYTVSSGQDLGTGSRLKTWLFDHDLRTKSAVWPPSPR